MRGIVSTEAITSFVCVLLYESYAAFSSKDLLGMNWRDDGVRTLGDQLSCGPHQHSFPTLVG